ncbi:hypothetical protein LTR12_012991 [Friedmanniomyces endolithicus]|nr:hypothetical protein LTR74_014330 [Friedmanniomyces endolithicus]KAK1812637.1 hypothetical protein LTR12_012991 [Friedmanniomyces endolithicus]
MSADDDTFEIDIYGDEDQAEADPELYPAQPEHSATDDSAARHVNGDDVHTNGHESATSPSNTSNPPPMNGTTEPSPPQPNLKRKASDANSSTNIPQTTNHTTSSTHSLDPSALPALKLSDLHWWTTEEDLRGICARASSESSLHDLSFNEHKVNGKSKGEAYLEFTTAQAATAVKRVLEAESREKEASGVRKAPFTAVFVRGGCNPYKGVTGAAAGGKKEAGGRGAYSSFGGQRGGGFAGRGGSGGGRAGFGGYRGGGGVGGQGQGQGQTQQQGGWGMNGMGGGGGMGGYGGGGFANPMMGMAAGYGSMGRGGMMNGMGGMMGNMASMMGRGGGFGGLGMGMPGMAAMGMGNGMMGGGGTRGGMMNGGGGGGSWGANGAAATGYGGGAGMPQQQQDPNKRMKMG